MTATPLHFKGAGETEQWRHECVSPLILDGLRKRLWVFSSHLEPGSEVGLSQEFEEGYQDVRAIGSIDTDALCGQLAWVPISEDLTDEEIGYLRSLTSVPEQLHADDRESTIADFLLSGQAKPEDHDLLQAIALTSSCCVPQDSTLSAWASNRPLSALVSIDSGRMRIPRLELLRSLLDVLRTRQWVFLSGGRKSSLSSLMESFEIFLRTSHDYEGIHATFDCATWVEIRTFQRRALEGLADWTPEAAAAQLKSLVCAVIYPIYATLRQRVAAAHAEAMDELTGGYDRSGSPTTFADFFLHSRPAAAVNDAEVLARSLEFLGKLVRASGWEGDLTVLMPYEELGAALFAEKDGSFRRAVAERYDLPPESEIDQVGRQLRRAIAGLSRADSAVATAGLERIAILVALEDTWGCLHASDETPQLTKHSLLAVPPLSETETTSLLAAAAIRGGFVDSSEDAVRRLSRELYLKTGGAPILAQAFLRVLKQDDSTEFSTACELTFERVRQLAAGEQKGDSSELDEVISAAQELLSGIEERRDTRILKRWKEGGQLDRDTFPRLSRWFSTGLVWPRSHDGRPLEVFVGYPNAVFACRPGEWAISLAQRVRQALLEAA